MSFGVQIAALQEKSMENAPSTASKHDRNDPKSADAKASIEAGQNAAKNAATNAADLARSQINATQENLHSGLTMAAETAHRSVSTFQERLTGDNAKEAMKRSAQHIEAISGAGTELSHGFREISREWMTFAKQGAEKWHAAFGALAECRSPQEFFEVQSRLTKENLETFVAGTRRICEISTAAAAKATQKIAAAQQTNA
jgi:hypothetical protein